MRTSPLLSHAARPYRFAFFFAQMVFVALLPALMSCASPGDPVERKPQVYAAITDVAATQSGNDVILTFTIPKETADHRPATTPPSVEIYRAIQASPSASPATNAAPALLVTIPPTMIATYIVDGKFRYADTLTPGDFLPNQQESSASYTVRTRASAKKESGDSNRAELNIFPAPLPIADLQARPGQAIINLSWSAPQATLTGGAPVITSYRIYRANAASSTATAPTEASAGASAPTAAKLASPLVAIGESNTPQYADTDVQSEKSYVYSVRSMIDTGASPAAAGKPLESADSNLAAVTLHDTYAPSAPTRLIATPVPAEAGTPAHMDLSWNINPETDIAGYNVYRSDQADTSGARINSQLLPTPAFSDMNTAPGRAYYYAVTAVDRTGNESAASASVQSALPAAAGNQTP